MAEYDNTNTGTLFINSYKEKGDKKPDLKGKININGEEYELAAWSKVFQKEGKDQKMLSLRVSPPYKKEEPKPKATATPSGEDDLPF